MALPLSPTMPPRAQRALMRRALMARISDHMPNWQIKLFDLAADEAPNDGPYYLLARAVMDGLQVTCWKGRLAFAAEAPVLRYCGEACGGATQKRHLALATLMVSAGEFRDSLLIPCSKELYDTYGSRMVDSAVGHLCWLVDEYVGRASDALHVGFAAARPELPTREALDDRTACAVLAVGGDVDVHEPASA